jgi:hypothetical protein
LSWLKAQEKSGNLRLRRFPFFGVSFALSVAPEEEVVVTVGYVRDKIALPAGSRMRWGGLWSCGHCDSCPCDPKWPKLAITRAWGMYKCDNTREGWEGRDGVVSDDICRVRHGCESDLVGEWLGAL